MTSFEVDRDIVASFPVTVTPDSIKAFTAVASFEVNQATVASFLVATDTSRVDHQLTSCLDLVATASSEVVLAAA